MVVLEVLLATELLDEYDDDELLVDVDVGVGVDEVLKVDDVLDVLDVVGGGLHVDVGVYDVDVDVGVQVELEELVELPLPKSHSPLSTPAPRSEK